jgi:mannose-6-phosphate isomerase
VRSELSRLEPIFQPRIWGASSLAPLFPEKTNLSEKLGEAWLTGAGCRFACGPFAGTTLGQAWKEMPAEWRGSRLAHAADFPLLIKFIFAQEQLSVQVHPDDAYASVHERAAGGRGKTEMWHALSADPGAEVLVGWKRGVTREGFLEGLAAHTVDKLLEPLPVAARDTFFIAARTPHTIGAGLVLCEVQQYSDLTYRVYDYGRVDESGRPRQLHIAKALEVMRFGNNLGGRTSPLRLGLADNGDMQRCLLAACPYFATERWTAPSLCELPRDESRFELLVFLSGEGALITGEGQTAYHKAQCWLVPASLEMLAVQPALATSFLRVYAPDLASLAQELDAAGHSRAAQSAVLFP